MSATKTSCPQPVNSDHILCRHSPPGLQHCRAVDQREYESPDLRDASLSLLAAILRKNLFSPCPWHDELSATCESNRALVATSSVVHSQTFPHGADALAFALATKSNFLSTGCLRHDLVRESNQQRC